MKEKDKKQMPYKQDIGAESSQYYRTFMEVWDARFAKDAASEANVVLEKPQLEEAPVSIENNIPLYKKRKGAIFITAILSFAAIVLALLDVFDIFKAYTQIAFIDTASAVRIMIDGITSIRFDNFLEKYLYSASLILAFFFMLITYLCSLGDVLSKKKVLTVIPAVLAFLFTLSSSAGLFLYTGSHTAIVSFFSKETWQIVLDFLTPGSVIHYGYYILLGLCLLSFVFSCISLKKKKYYAE